MFGSRAQNTARPMSDFDFAVLLKNPRVLTNSQAKIKLYNNLYSLLSDGIRSFTPIDIVFLDNAPLYLQYQVIKYGKVLYTSHPNIPADFKQLVLEKYTDFAPIRKEFRRLTLERI